VRGGGGARQVGLRALDPPHPAPLSPLAAVALNRATYAAALRHLLVDAASHRVAVFEPTGAGGGGAAAWKKAKEGSPGRLAAFDADLRKPGGDTPDAPPLLAVVLAAPGAAGARRVGACALDGAAATLAAAEFDDDAGYGALEALAASLGVREAMLAAPGAGAPAAAAAAAAEAALVRAGALVSPAPRPTFAAQGLPSDLARLLRSKSVEQHRDVLDRPLAASAVAGALAASGALAGGADASGRWSLALLTPNATMRLDAAAAAALGVADARPGADPAASALARLLGVARTRGGARLLPAWLKSPMRDPAAIAARHDVVAALDADAGLRCALRDALLRGLPDVERAAARLERGTATLADLCSLYRASARVGSIETALRAHDGATAGVLASWFADPFAAARAEDGLGRFEALVEAAIDLDRVPDEYLVRAEYDDSLADARAAKDAAEARVSAAAAAAAKDLGTALDKGVKLEWYKPGGAGGAATRVRCLRLTAAEERRVRAKLAAGRYTQLETRKDGTKFTSPALKAAADELGVADAAVAQRQVALAAQVVAVAATFAPLWATVGKLIAELDVLASFAAVGASAPAPWVRPTMAPEDGATLSLVDCRHPVVEALAGVDFVPNSLAMRKGESWFAVVTGPNMGGKSTFIRQAGVACLLAQAGCFVPAASATLPIRDAIFARVGAGDCQARGVSTFMAEMLETAAILRGATPASLVIVDELGRGTSTVDGLGLAAAISESLLADARCPVLFATHFHELTALSGPTGVANMHVVTAADAGGGGGGVTMLHRVALGASDDSFGVACAVAARLPPDVVADARARAAAIEAGDGGEPGAKRARVEASPAAAAANVRARAFLAAVAALPAGDVAGARVLVDNLRAEGLPELQALLAA